jgi:choline dehydrogenase
MSDTTRPTETTAPAPVPSPARPDLRGRFDLIVVGAGSAGSVIAARVAQAGRRRVLLVEAGPDYPDAASLPADLADGGRNSMYRHDWGYKHRPAPGQILFPLPRGRVVGGSSMVNTCIALRPQPRDLAEWVERGLPEWSWEACLPYFKRLERDLDFGHDREWHGDDGPLPLRRHRPEELVPWQSALLEACDRLGLPSCDDSNRPGTTGASPHAMNKVNGRRIGAAQAWLTPAVRALPNLTIASETLVRRVVFERAPGAEPRAVAVELLGRGAGPGAEATRVEADEIVLCAGAINTPGLLLRSGIGPRAELARLGVEVVAESPAVGARLLDHPGAALIFRPRLGAPTSRHDPLIQVVYRWGAEPGYANDMVLQAGSKFAMPRANWPLVSLMTAVGKSKGSGTLRWPSADPLARPIIDSAVLAHPEDHRRAVDALALAWELSQTPPMRAIARPFFPSARVAKDRALLGRRIFRFCDSGYHPSGTVPMGADDDRGAATDGRGRVRGVQGLVVADASLMPVIPSSHIHLTVLMMGERFGEWLAGGRAGA